MTANVIRLPVVRKRGRKVTKGPKAEVRVIYYLAEEEDEDSSDDHTDTLESSIERMARLIADRAVRKRIEWAAILTANPQIVEFPKDRRYRSLVEVDEHRRFHEDGILPGDRIDEIAESIANRAKEIMGDDEGLA